MSARVSSVDRDAGVVWIAYEGRGDELSANLSVYGVAFVPALRNGVVGITFKKALGDDLVSVFGDAASDLISVLTARSGITERHERMFATSLMIVQMGQGRDDSQQARDLSEWVRGARIGGAT